jgi:phosphoglycolate phosphatase
MANYIFDFDGTLVDSLLEMVDMYNQIRPRGYPEVRHEDVQVYRKLSSRQVLREMGVPLWKAARIVRRGLAEYRRRLPGMKTFAGMPSTLRTMQKRGDRLFIVTSNNITIVQAFLEKQHLEKYFEDIYGGASIFGKAPYLRKIVKNCHLDKAETFYIGDETRDIEAARKARMPIISVAWGFNDESVLTSHHPDFLVHTPAELLKITKV